ncbi:hypothetical protein B5807_06942 [Epicoccum nigrum]|uniref:Uncharacterized protein n=1 Tax=Epicoccum nigrum TaxID=105696 RepID=A0A1Y2LY24_EPING|nr:hypothetical protein B5807_06942 [Epicoccum nigrum]
MGNSAVSKASLSRKVNVCLHPWSRTRFEMIALNKIPGRVGELMNTSSRVKGLIIEDVRVAYSDLYFDLSKAGVDLSEHAEDLTSQIEQFKHQLYYNPSGFDAMEVAAKQLIALETIERDPGSTRIQRARGFNHQLSGNAYVDPQARYEETWQCKIQELIEKDTWESRSKYFLAVPQQDTIHATRYMFCKVVGSVLQTRHPRTKQLTVGICSPVPCFFNSVATAALYSNSTHFVRYLEWPTNNRLQNLELPYASL